jgi:AICAR transformylase/IMP cyclohydrolase PurH
MGEGSCVMSEMVEKVRIAIRRAQDEWDRVVHTDAYFPNEFGHYDDRGLFLARAAIEAMVEPTDKMIRRAMIEAALKS